MEMVPVMAVEIARTARMEMGAAIIPALIQIKHRPQMTKIMGITILTTITVVLITKDRLQPRKIPK